MKRLGGFFVAFVSAVSLVVSGFVPVFAAELGPAAPFEAADLLSARVQAGLRGHRVLVGDELEADSSTWVNPDGTLTTEVFGSPVRVRDVAGRFGWRDLDFTLVFASDGSVVARSGLLPLSISGGGSAAQVAASGLVSVTSGSDVFGFGWGGALPRPVLVGDTARFVDVLPGVDLLVRLDASGFEQFFEVKSRPDQVTLDSLRLLVRSKNVSVVANSLGGYDFVSASGLVASIGDASIYDSGSGAVGATVAPLDVSLVGRVLDLGVGGSFFDNPDLIYPVVVDPSVTFGSSLDTYVSNVYPSTDFQSATDLLVGTPDAGVSKYRSFLNFSSSGWQGQDVISAKLNLFLNWSWSCVAKPFTVYASAGPVVSATRWSNQPITAGGSVSTSVAAGYNSSCAGSWVNVDVSAAATVLASQTGSSVALTLRAGNESDSTGWKRFNSANASTNKPSLVVTYNRYPSSALGVSVADLVSVAGVDTVAALHPSFSATATDPDGQAVTLTFKSFASATSLTPLATLCSVSVASGTAGSCRSTVALSNGQMAYVRAIANDGRVDAKSFSAVAAFMVDSSEPAAPAIACPYVDGYAGGVVPTSAVVCTVKMAAVAAKFRATTVKVTVDDQSPLVFTPAADGSLSETVSLKAGSFQHSLKAVAVNGAGVSSVDSTYVMSFGRAGIISPTQHQFSSTSVRLSSYSRNNDVAYATVYNARLQVRLAGTTNSWVTVNASLPYSVRNGVTGVYDFLWNLQSTDFSGVAGVSSLSPFSVEARVCYSYTWNVADNCTDDSSVLVTVLPDGFDSTVTQGAGPGLVSVANGVFKLSATDVSQSVGLVNLDVSRTFVAGSLAATAQGGVFGPGWTGSFTSDASMIAKYELFTSSSSPYVYLLSNSGDVLTFLQFFNGVYVAADDPTRNAHLVLSGTGGQVTVTEQDGATTSYSFANNSWHATCASDGTGASPVISVYNADGTVKEVGYVSGSTSCATPSSFTRSLKFTYSSVGSRSLLTQVALSGFTGSPKPVATYAYNSDGLLASATDNFNGTVVSYEYELRGQTRFLHKVVEQGFAPYGFVYDATNRLVQVQRTQNWLFIEQSVVDQTFVYDLNPSTNQGVLPNLPASTTNLWGQTSAPVSMFAVFGADTAVPLTANGAPNLSTSSALWKNASYRFISNTGQESNTAEFGKTGWLYTAKLFNSDNAVDASFDEYGISRVLADYAADPSIRFDATKYASVNRFYTAKINNHDITDSTWLSETWSPIHTVVNSIGADQTVRTHTSFVYDQNAPPTDFFGLVTEQTIGVTFGANLTSTNDQQLSRTINDYGSASTPTDPTSGWKLGLPLQTQTFGANNQLVSTNSHQFNSFGQPMKTVLPGSDGLDGRTTNYTYYTSATQTIHPECGGHPAWDHLLCFTETPTVATLPDEYVASYDTFLNPAEIRELDNSGNTLRTTLQTFYDDGRENTSETVAPATISIKTVQQYDSVSLANTGTQLFYGNALQSETHQTFDAWGRAVTVTNSLGETETTTYIQPGVLGAGLISQIVNPKTTSTYTYGGPDSQNFNDPRAVATHLKVVSTNSSTFQYDYTASYDDYGQIVEQTTNQITQAFTYNDAQQLENVNYLLPADTGLNTLLSYQRQYDAYGRVITETEPDSTSNYSPTKTNTYTYDPAGRLATSHTTTTASCTDNSYSYDPAGNRTSTTQGTCNAGVTKTATFNSFSQQTSAGYSYDPLGRNTVIPANDTPHPTNGAITLGYNLLNQIQTITQNGSTTSYTYDPQGRRLNETTNGTTLTRHYTDNTDNPAWATNTGNNPSTEIYTPSLGASLNIITTITGSTKTSQIQIHDLHGNTATSINLDTHTTTNWQNYDEYGNPTTPTSSGLINYNTYSQAERATNTNTGLILMGARVYNPTTNQFTTPDPITGGNENPYTYPNDPINFYDFGGLVEGPFPIPPDPEIQREIEKWLAFTGNPYKADMGDISLNLALRLLKYWFNGRKINLERSPGKKFLRFRSPSTGRHQSRDARLAVGAGGKIKMNLERGRGEAEAKKMKNWTDLHYSVSSGSIMRNMEFLEINVGGGGIRDFKK